MTWSRSYRRRAGARVTVVLTLLGAVLAAPPAAHAAVSFAPRAPFTTAAFPRAIAVADLNGDGALDLVVANEGMSPGPGSVSVLLADTGVPGTYLPAVDYAADDFPSDLVVADVNRDGIPDILVVNFSVATLSVLVGNGDGTFAPRADYAAGAGAYALGVGDFNRDGLADVAITNSSQSTVSVLLGSTSAPGTFPTRVEYATSADPTGLVIGDFDRDGIPDIAAAVFGGATVAILRGNGDGTFPATAEEYPAGDAPRAITAGDFDGDGVLDLAVSNYFDQTITVLRGSASTPGSFASGGTYDTDSAGFVESLASADLDGDGDLDLVATIFTTEGPVSVLIGNGDATFNAAVDFQTGDDPRGIAVADLDGDGRPDIALADLASDTVSVLLNTTMFRPTAAFGRADFSVSGSPRTVATGDFNRDSIVDVVTANGISVSVGLGNGDGTLVDAGLLAGTMSAPTGVAVADIDRDGNPDIVWMNAGTGIISVALGNGDGTFQTAVDSATGSPGAQYVVLADLRRNGIVDAIVPDLLANRVVVRHGAGDGTFSGGATYATGTRPRSVTVGDLDDDGDPDLVAANTVGNSVSVLLNNGDGTFGAAADYATAAGPRGVAVGDVNGDGALDVVTANNGSFSVLPGNGDGTLGTRTDHPGSGTYENVVLVDIDRAGVLDVVLGHFTGGAVTVALGNVGGAFGGAVAFPLGTGAAYVVVADMDHDGRPDLVASNTSAHAVSVLLARAAVFTFNASAYSVAESAVSKTITVTRTGDTSTAMTVAYATSAGTAMVGSDYTETSGTLSFAIGQSSDTFEVPIVNDALPEGNETITLALSNPTGDAGLTVPSAAVLTIADNDPVLRFSSATYAFSEGPDTRLVTVTRTGGLGMSVTVDYATSNATATAGQDYTTVVGTLSFGPSVTSLTFGVPILNDTLTEGAETINLTLSSPGGGAVLGTPSAAVLTINANDPPKLQFSSATYAIPEGPDTRFVTVTRTGGSGTTVTVQYATSNGTATAGQDYTAATGTLTFGPNVTSLTFGVSILQDTLTEGAETINLTLSSPGGGAVLGTPSTAVLTINANDAPQLQFSGATYTVDESAGSRLITVTRTGGVGTSVTVHYATSNGTAAAGADYTAVSGTLSFGPNVTSLTFAVPILNDTLTEDAQTINLTLSSPGGGAGLGAQPTAVLTILANDVPRLQFQSAAYAGAERDGVSAITVTRTGGFGTTVTVRYATSDGTAQAGVDYASTTGTLTFGPNDTTRTFAVTIVNDTRTEGAETVGLTLSSPGGGAVLGTPSTAVLTIAASD